MVSGMLAEMSLDSGCFRSRRSCSRHDMDYLTNFERKFRKEGRPIYRRFIRNVFHENRPRPTALPRLLAALHDRRPLAALQRPRHFLAHPHRRPLLNGVSSPATPSLSPGRRILDAPSVARRSQHGPRYTASPGSTRSLLAAATLLAGLFSVADAAADDERVCTSAVAVVITGITIAATATHLHVRPMLFTTVCTRGHSGVCSSITKIARSLFGGLYWLIRSIIVWTNIHGGMLGGLLSLGLVIFGWVLWRILSWPSPLHSIDTVYMLMLLIVLCTATMLRQSVRREIPQTWLKIMQGSRDRKLHRRAPTLESGVIRRRGAVLLFAALYLFVLAGTYQASSTCDLAAAAVLDGADVLPHPACAALRGDWRASPWPRCGRGRSGRRAR